MSEFSEKLKLHLGCGIKYLPGYKHIDLIKYDHIDYIAPLDKLDMFDAGSI